MRKLLLIILLLTPSLVLAANPKVTSLSAKINNNVITFNGEVENGSYAVMCKLIVDDKEVDMLSTSVDKNKFNGKFNVNSSAIKKIACANYEGGEITTTTVEETKGETTSNDVENVKESVPNTLDNIGLYINIGFISLLSILGISLYYKKVR